MSIALIITMEECGELIQACSKVIRHKNDLVKFPKWMESLTEEAGDVLAMIDILVEEGYLKKEDLEQRKIVKREKLEL